MSSERKQTVQKEQKGEVRGDSANQAFRGSKTEKVLIPGKLHAAKIGDVELEIPKGLGDDTFVIAVVGKDGILAQFTVHRAIGYADCPGGSFVLTPSSEVSTLLSRASNPAEQRIGKACAVYQRVLAEEAGIAEQTDDDLIMVHEGEYLGSMKEALEGAETRHKEAKKSHLEQHNAAQEGKPHAAKYRGFGEPVEAFLEGKVSDWFKEYRALKDTDFYREYRQQLVDESGFATRWGPLQDRMQVSMAGLPNGANRRQALDGVISALAMLGGYAESSAVPGTKSVQAIKRLADKESGGLATTAPAFFPIKTGEKVTAAPDKTGGAASAPPDKTGGAASTASGASGASGGRV